MRDHPPAAADTEAAKVAYYSRQYNARAEIPDHPQLFERWQATSALVRRTHAGLLDLPFGSSPGERLDFYPATRPGAPLLVFIHGGWWRSLDKSDFTFIVPGFRDAGLNVALTNYTLAPEASIEDITRQQLRAFAWLYEHAEHYEIDRSRIVVAGHSAGAHLAAMMMVARWSQFSPSLPADLVKAGILMSGLYDLDPVRYASFVNVDLKITEANALPLSPAYMSQPHAIPFITSVGDLESDEFKRQTALIAHQWRDAHRGDVALQGVNHLTICDAFAQRDHPLFEQSLALISSL
jgi:arylformamidase